MINILRRARELWERLTQKDGNINFSNISLPLREHDCKEISMFVFNYEEFLAIFIAQIVAEIFYGNFYERV